MSNFYIQSFMHEACLAYCYSWIVHRDLFAGQLAERMTQDVINGYFRWGVIDDEATVLNADKYLYYCASQLQRFRVTKKEIIDITTIKEATPVRFDYKGGMHWVVVENGQIVFDAWKNSQCVRYGKPTTARVIEWLH